MAVMHSPFSLITGIFPCPFSFLWLFFKKLFLYFRILFLVFPLPLSYLLLISLLMSLFFPWPLSSWPFPTLCLYFFSLLLDHLLLPLSLPCPLPLLISLFPTPYMLSLPCTLHPTHCPFPAPYTLPPVPSLLPFLHCPCPFPCPSPTLRAQPCMFVFRVPPYSQDDKRADISALGCVQWRDRSKGRWEG